MFFVVAIDRFSLWRLAGFRCGDWQVFVVAIGNILPIGQGVRGRQAPVVCSKKESLTGPPTGGSGGGKLPVVCIAFTPPLLTPAAV